MGWNACRYLSEKGDIKNPQFCSFEFDSFPAYAQAVRRQLIGTVDNWAPLLRCLKSGSRRKPPERKPDIRKAHLLVVAETLGAMQRAQQLTICWAGNEYDAKQEKAEPGPGIWRKLNHHYTTCRGVIFFLPRNL